MLKKLLQQHKIERPFGVFLSGGLDSGVVAAVLKPDFAIHCSFDGDKYDESEYAIAIAEHLKIPLTIIKPNGKDFDDVLKESLKILGKPVNSVSIYPWYKSMEYARAMGAKRMLGGEGSDETFGGYSRYIILKAIKGLYDNESLQGYHPMLDSIFGSFVDVHSKLCGVPRETLLERYKEQNGFISQIGWAEFTESLAPITAMEHSFADHFGIELHLPFYDKEVQEYGWSLKDEDKLDGEIRKKKVYELAKELLPEKVWKRKHKQGFISPCNEWCGDKPHTKDKYLKKQEEICNQ